MQFNEDRQTNRKPFFKIFEIQTIHQASLIKLNFQETSRDQIALKMRLLDFRLVNAFQIS